MAHQSTIEPLGAAAKGVTHDIDEKLPAGHHEGADAALTEEDGAPKRFMHGLTEEEKILEKKLRRKIDWRWAPLTIIYILNYVDRNAMPAARLKGFQRDTGVTNDQYETAISIFFIGYILMQIPSNWLLNYLGRPSFFISTTVFLWGIVSLCGGFVQNYQGVFAVRFFLGFIEAPFFPGALFCISKWYTKKELATRQVLIYVASSLSSAFSGLITAAILSRMEGVLGHPGWRWLFWIEGSVTCVVACMTVFILPDFPHNSKFLSEEERALAVKRLALETGETDDDTVGFWPACKKCFMDYRVLLFCLAMYCHNTSFSFTSYFPTIVKTLGYSTTQTLLLTAPPWAFSAILILVVAYFSDKFGSRYVWIMASMALTLPGFIILIATESDAVAARYVAMFLMLSSHAGYILLFSWLSTTVPRPSAKRSVAIALVNSVGQLGQITGGYLFPEEWSPNFRQSWAILISMSVGAMLVYTVIYIILRRANGKMDHQNYYVTEQGKLRQYESEETLGTERTMYEENRRGWRYAL